MKEERKLKVLILKLNFKMQTTRLALVAVSPFIS